MAYAYSDYITIDDTVAREAQLRLHIKEVSDEITADVTKGPQSRSTGNLMPYRSELRDELKELVTVNRQKSGSRANFANMNGAAP